ncbi:hypothetical protein Tco_0211267 [Tanacetum coccineum]
MHGLLTLSPEQAVLRTDKRPHAHIQFTSIKSNSTLRIPNVPPHQLISSDVAELKDMVRALLLDKQTSLVPAPAPVKVVEQSCVTCGGAHSYRNCPATNSNNYRDNIQEYVSQAAAANFNQGNSGYRPPPMANQIRPPGFPPMQHNSQANNQNRWNQNQNRGNGYNQGQIQRPQHTIANPKGDVKAITTRSGVSYNGPQISSPPKEKENEPEATKDTCTKHRNIQPQGANKEKLHEKDNLLASKFMESFRNSPFPELKFLGTLPLTHAQDLHQCLRKLLNTRTRY